MTHKSKAYVPISSLPAELYIPFKTPFSIRVRFLWLPWQSTHQAVGSLLCPPVSKLWILGGWGLGLGTSVAPRRCSELTFWVKEAGGHALGAQDQGLVTSWKDLAGTGENAFPLPAQGCCFLLLLCWDVNHRKNGFWSTDATHLHSFSEEVFLPEGSLLAMWYSGLGVCQCHLPPRARGLEEVDPGVQDMRSRLGERAETWEKELLKWESLRRAKETRAFCPGRQRHIQPVMSFRYGTRSSSPPSRPVLLLSLVNLGRSFIYSKYNMRGLN